MNPQVKRHQAVSLLQHYMRTAFQRAGAKWDHDNDVEVADIVDCIVDAAAEKAAEQRRDALGA